MLKPTVTPKHSLTADRVGIRTTVRLATVLLLCGIAGCATSHKVCLQQQGRECMNVPTCYGYQPTLWHPWPLSVTWDPCTVGECDCPSTVIDYPEAASLDVSPPGVFSPSLPQEVPDARHASEPPQTTLQPPANQQSWREPWTSFSECRRLPSLEQGYEGTRLENRAPVLRPAAGPPPSRL